MAFVAAIALAPLSRAVKLTLAFGAWEGTARGRWATEDHEATVRDPRPKRAGDRVGRQVVSLGT
jgi:hypothetical protein